MTNKYAQMSVRVTTFWERKKTLIRCWLHGCDRLIIVVGQYINKLQSDGNTRNLTTLRKTFILLLSLSLSNTNRFIYRQTIKIILIFSIFVYELCHNFYDHLGQANKNEIIFYLSSSFLERVWFFFTIQNPKTFNLKSLTFISLYYYFIASFKNPLECVVCQHCAMRQIAL